MSRWPWRSPFLPSLLSVYDSYDVRGPLLNTKKTGCTRGCSVCHAARHYVSLGVDLNELLLRDGGAQAVGTTGMMTGLSLPWPWEMSTFQKPGKTQNYGSAWWQPGLSVGRSFWKIPTRIYEHQHPEAGDFSVFLLCKLSSTFSHPAPLLFRTEEYLIKEGPETKQDLQGPPKYKSSSMSPISYL